MKKKNKQFFVENFDVQSFFISTNGLRGVGI